ncbi:MAG: DNA topoisomerase III, partial [Lachnospiraceae bacterium]|nr:DNA topoisomerase III [Lachnospiraceae bacterium]
YCSGFKAEPKCNFTMWKKDKFWESRGKKLTKAMAIKMLQGAKVKVKGLKKKSGEGTYDAYISMVDTGKWVNYEMTFEK